MVSANKDLLAVHGSELLEIAKKHQVALYYEAAVAGGIPILRTLVNSLASDKVTKVLGVVNGTSNFMMTKMVEEGWTYEDALAEAQRLGYAESDPTNDVEGIPTFAPDRKSTRLNSSHLKLSRMPSSA